MTLNDEICYTLIHVVYYDSFNLKTPHVHYEMLDLGENREINTWQDLKDYIEKTYDVEINSMMIIAENGLEGKVLRYDNYDGLREVGTTRGYA